MRFALTAIPVAMFCSQAVAVGLTQQEMQQMDSYWAAVRKNQELPEECRNLDDLGIPPQCYEKALLQHAAIARRDGGKLILKMTNEEKIYANSAAEGVYNEYEFIGYVAELDSFILRHWFAMDASADIIVSRKTGEEEAELYGSPLDHDSLKFNADGTKMLDYNYSESSSSGLQVYSYDRRSGFKAIYNDRYESDKEPHPILGAQKSCLEWEGKRSSGDRLYLEDYSADWVKGSNDEIVVNAKYMGDSFYTKYTCNVTSH